MAYKPAIMNPDVIIDPDGFFKRQVGRANWSGPILIVLTVALIDTIGQVPVSGAFLEITQAGMDSLVNAVQLLSAFFAFAGPFLVWFIYTIIIHVTASFAFGADGDFNELMKLLGWGFIPSILGSLLNMLVAFQVYTNANFPENPQEAQVYIQQLQQQPVFLVSSLVGIAVLLWSAQLWTFAVRRARDLNLRAAAITVAPPVVISLAFRVAGLLRVIQL